MVIAVERLKKNGKEAQGKRIINWDKIVKEFDLEHSPENKIWLEKHNRIFFGGKWNPEDTNSFRSLYAAYQRLKKHGSTRTSNFDFSDFGDTMPSFISDKKQRVMAKFFYSEKADAHERYLNRYMPQKDKKDVIDKPEIFGNISMEEYQEKMAPNCYKWVLSPEKKCNARILKEMAKCFVARCEAFTYHKFDWQAVVHMNTEHPHVHILINGVDQKGKYFRFRKALIRAGILREQAMEIATHMLGERTPEEIAMDKDRQLVADRCTTLDVGIETLAEPCKTMKGYSHVVRNVDFSGTRLGRRLAHLVDLGIAVVQRGNVYLEENWTDTLRSLGRYNTFIQARAHLRDTYGRELELYKSEMGRIQGKVRYAYMMNDEGIWNNAYVIEKENSGKAWYVPLYKNTTHKLVGSTVEIEPKPNQRGKLTPSITVLEWGRNAKSKDDGDEKRNPALPAEVKKDTGHQIEDDGMELC